jgi:hypothetical protein
MAACGNRAKVARHRLARTRPDGRLRPIAPGLDAPREAVARRRRGPPGRRRAG